MSLIRRARAVQARTVAGIAEVAALERDSAAASVRAKQLLAAEQAVAEDARNRRGVRLARPLEALLLLGFAAVAGVVVFKTVVVVTDIVFEAWRVLA